MSVTTPARLGPLTLRNRVIKAATFEGMSPGGRVSPALVAHHVAMARAAGLTTLAYGAVSPDGRTFADQIVIDTGAKAGLRALADAVHAEGSALCVQLSHCGGFTRLPGTPGGPSPGWNAYGLVTGAPRVRALAPDAIEAIVEAFGRATAVARTAGVDAVEIHAGHGYLLSQFLSPLFNHRRDAWGGEHRDRLAIEVVRAVRAAAGEGMAVLVKLNTSDGVPGGFQPDDAIRVARALEGAGADAIVPSGGLVQRTPFFLLRGEAPWRAMAAAEHHPLQRGVMRWVAPWWMRSPAYTPTFFFDDAARILDAVDIPVALLGGVDSAAAIRRALARGFPFVAMARALLADPDFVDRIVAGEDVVSRCDHCNRCVAEMERGGVRCVL